MKKLFALFLLLFSIHQNVNAQSYIPIGTTGYTHDAIAENTTAISTTSGPLDGVNVLYSAAHAALISSPYGLPNSGLLSAGSKTFQLQNYAGPNMLFIQPAGKDSLTFITPVPCQSLSLLDFATDAFAPTSMSVTIRFTDNSTQVFTGVTVYDWLYSLVSPFANGFDRMNRSSGSPANEGGSGNPRFFTNDFAISCANQSKLVKRIIIKNTGTSNEKLCILAVAGVIMPLTATASPANLCTTGGTATLTAAGLSNYTWMPSGSFAGATTTVVSVTPSVTTDYTVQTTNSGCTYSTMVTVTVFSVVPTLTVTNTANAGGICPNSTVILTASGATSYSWAGGSTAVTNGVAFGPTIAADYTVTGSNACGSTTAVTSVSVHPFPTVNPVASSASLCSGGSVTLTATGNATNYAWSGGPGGITNGVGFAPPLTATYTVIGTSALSCTASATIPVTVVITPSIAPLAQPALVCLGKSTSLTALGATGYTWTGGASVGNSSVYVVTPSNPGLTTYTVVRLNSTCSTTAQVSVVTNSLPVAFAIVSGPTLVCAASAVTLAVAGGQTYTWTSPGNPPVTPSYTFTGANPVVFPPVNTVYTVAAHDGTCIGTTTVAVSVNPTPTLLTTASSTMICAGQVVTVSVSGGNNYTWTASSSSATFNTATFTDTPSQSISYNVTGDNSFGCTSSAAQIVVVNLAPTVSATAILNKTLTCNGGTLSLSAGGAGTYSWSNGASGNTVVVTPTNVTSGPVVYTVTGTNTITQCSATKTIAVNVFIPTLTISGNTITCIGGPISLNASGGSNSWSWETPGNPPVPGFSSLNATISAAAIFTVSAKTNSLSISCPASATVDVDVYPNPSIAAVAQRTTICVKESVVLTASGGTAYVWSNNLQTMTISVAPGTNTTYTVTGTDINGCSNTGTVSVKVLGCTGIAESSAGHGWTVYPNPNNGSFVIRSNTDACLRLINELGQVVRNLVLNSANQYEVTITDVANGVYYLTGQKDGLYVNQKIIVSQ